MTSHDPGEISARTLAHYDASAESFRAGTWDHDVSQNGEALLRHVEGAKPFTILDLGCGAGWLTNILNMFGPALGVDLAEVTVQTGATQGDPGALRRRRERGERRRGRVAHENLASRSLIYAPSLPDSNLAEASNGPAWAGVSRFIRKASSVCDRTSPQEPLA